MGIATTDLRFLHVAGPSFEEVARHYGGAEFVGARVNFAPEYFARTIAKVAFCAGVYAGFAPFRQTPFRRAILGEDGCLGHWVGSWTGTPMNEPTGLHAMQIRASGTDLHVVLRLFAQFGTPEYHVALGPADPDFANSEAWPWKGSEIHAGC